MVRATHPQPRKPGSSRSRFALVNWRVRWRLAAVIAVPTLTAAVLGALTINGDVNNWQATGRVQHLAQLNADTVKFSQALEDELNVSAAYAATRPNNGALAGRAEAGAERHRQRRQRGPQRLLGRHHSAPGTSRAPCRTSTRCRRPSTTCRTSARVSPASLFPASQIVRVYSENLIAPANTFSAAIGTGANDADPAGQRHHAGRAAAERERAVGAAGPPVRRAHLARRGHSARRISPPCSRPPSRQRRTWLTSTPPRDTAEQQTYSNTVSGAPVDVAASDEILAEQMAANSRRSR